MESRLCNQITNQMYKLSNRIQWKWNHRVPSCLRGCKGSKGIPGRMERGQSPGVQVSRGKQECTLNAWRQGLSSSQRHPNGERISYPSERIWNANVEWVPDVQARLLNPGQLFKDGFRVEIYKTGTIVRSPEGQVIIQAEEQANVYPFYRCAIKRRMGYPQWRGINV